MSLNFISLPSRLVVDLYQHSLVETVVSNPLTPHEFSYLGNNTGKIAVLVHYADWPYLPDAQLNFLSAVLSACKLSLSDIAIINRDKVQNDELLTFLEQKASTILLFGAEPSAIGLPINFPPYRVQAFNGSQYLHGDSLELIEKDKGLKQQLWTALKNLFRI